VIKDYFKSKFGKRATMLTAMMAVMIVSAVSASAAPGDLTIDTSQVTNTFSSMATTVGLVIASVAGVAVIIMGSIMAWKYGRKLFAMLAK